MTIPPVSSTSVDTVIVTGYDVGWYSYLPRGICHCHREFGELSGVVAADAELCQRLCFLVEQLDGVCLCPLQPLAVYAVHLIHVVVYDGMYFLCRCHFRHGCHDEYEGKE